MHQRTHSLFLLGNQNLDHSFKRYQELAHLCQDAGEFLTYDEDQHFLSCYALDAQKMQTKLPLLVFRPFNADCIAPFLKHCHARSIGVIPRCGGSGLVGGCIAGTESVIILTGHLKKIENYDPEKGTLIAEPGVSINQLNQFTEAEQWHYPLSMASNGVAGLAGSLCANARGYHQQQKRIFQAVENVTLIDGTGSQVEIPSSFICGTEGLWGIVVKMKIQLKKRPHQTEQFVFPGGWPEIMEQIPFLQTLQSLNYLIYDSNQFFLGLEGDASRLGAVSSMLKKRIPLLESSSRAPDKVHAFFPKRKQFVMVSSAFCLKQLPEACLYSLELAKDLQLECRQLIDLLAGSVQLILESNDNTYTFSQKVERFLVSWADFLDTRKGILASCHGVGMQMRPYMTPFWSEETIDFWRRVQSAFDPKGILGRDHFFPPDGKSLEKASRHDCP